MPAADEGWNCIENLVVGPEAPIGLARPDIEISGYQRCLDPGVTSRQPFVLGGTTRARSCEVERESVCRVNRTLHPHIEVQHVELMRIACVDSLSTVVDPRGGLGDLFPV